MRTNLLVLVIQETIQEWYQALSKGNTTPNLLEVPTEVKRRNINCGGKGPKWVAEDHTSQGKFY